MPAHNEQRRVDCATDLNHDTTTHHKQEQKKKTTTTIMPMSIHPNRPRQSSSSRSLLSNEGSHDMVWRHTMLICIRHAINAIPLLLHWSYGRAHIVLRFSEQSRGRQQRWQRRGSRQRQTEKRTRLLLLVVFCLLFFSLPSSSLLFACLFIVFVVVPWRPTNDIWPYWLMTYMWPLRQHVIGWEWSCTFVSPRSSFWM